MWARINAFHAHYTFWVVEFFPRQVEDVDLHWAFYLAMWAFGAFYWVAFDSGEAMFLEERHESACWANVAAPEPWNLPRGAEESYQDEYSQSK